jgi:hypothetical protein
VPASEQSASKKRRAEAIVDFFFMGPKLEHRPVRA